MKLWHLIAAGSTLVVLALIWGGAQVPARLALMAGLPQIAAPLLQDPAVRGVALYRAGEYAQSDRAFQQAGRNSTFNRGVSLAATGDLPLSRAYFLAVLFVNPADSQARENLARVEALIPPHQGVANQAGRIKATAYATEGGAQVDGVRRLAPPIDKGGRVADAQWLDSLPDDAGEFLRLRLAEEHLRRLALGLTAPQEGDPW